MCEPDIPFFIICTTGCGFRFRCTASQVLLDGFAFSMIPRMRLCTAAHLRWGRRRRRSIPPQAACGRVWRETFSLFARRTSHCSGNRRGVLQPGSGTSSSPSLNFLSDVDARWTQAVSTHAWRIGFWAEIFKKRRKKEGRKIEKRKEQNGIRTNKKNQT